MPDIVTKPVPPITRELIEYLKALYPASGITACSSHDDFVSLQARVLLIDDLETLHSVQTKQTKELTYHVRSPQT